MAYCFKRVAAVACMVLVLLSALPATAEDDLLTVLLIGVDTAGEAGRSDTMILAQINPSSGTVWLASFLRDLYVTIPGHGKDRLNAAYFYGGESLLRRTLEKNFGIRIDHTATVHFPTLVSVVDALGGVEVDVTEAERRQLNLILQRYNLQNGTGATGGLLAASGMQRLSGKQALSYCRIRKIDSDFQRTDRQQRVLQAVADQLKMQDAFSLLRLSVTLLDEVETDMNLADIAALVPLLSAGNLTVRRTHVPFDGEYSDETVNGMMVLIPNLDRNRSKLQRFLKNE